MKDLNLKPIEREGALELLCTGRLTMGNNVEFENFMKNTFAEDRHKKIGLNMKYLEMVDSSGLSAMIKLIQEAKNHRVELIYFGASDSIINIIKLARLNTLISFTTESDFNNRFPEIL